MVLLFFVLVAALVVWALLWLNRWARVAPGPSAGPWTWMVRYYALRFVAGGVDRLHGWLLWRRADWREFQANAMSARLDGYFAAVLLHLRATGLDVDLLALVAAATPRRPRPSGPLLAWWVAGWLRPWRLVFLDYVLRLKGRLSV